MEIGKIEIKINEIGIKRFTFDIPNNPTFPDEYKKGSIEVGVWPPPGLMRSVLDTEGALERLREWSIENILLGYIEGDHSESVLRDEQILIRVVSSTGVILLDTFDILLLAKSKPKET